MKEPDSKGYFEFISNELKKSNVPEEVWGVLLLQRSNAVVGKTVFDLANRIIEKYPEHFPWEARYRLIPKEVHEAYAKEAGWVSLGAIKRLFETPLFDNKGSGLMQAIKKSGSAKLDPAKSFHDFLKDFNEGASAVEEKKRQRHIKDKMIWDKYYKKYNLDYIL